MAGEVHEENFSYTSAVIGESYQPIPPANTNAPKTFIPPQGGTGARTLELKTVPIATDKK